MSEFNDPELGEAISGVFHNGHRNFYENQNSLDEMRQTIESAEEALPTLEALQREAPRLFTITSNRQLRRLASLIGNRELQIGDSSPVGFSLRHQPGGDNGSNPTIPSTER